ncbi:hypothetical protein VTK56DRAFT_6975 [Thermocarpiscus australiensis]
MMLPRLQIGLLWWSSLVVGSPAEYPDPGVPFLCTEDPVTVHHGARKWINDPILSSRESTTHRCCPALRLHRREEVIAPYGYQKNSILINGQFPGPLIEANWGDTIQVTVRNGLKDPEEGTSIHWHGLLQNNSPFTYTFTADSYGTSWYHSHFSAQYADGAFGPIVIHGPQTEPYDVDYYHRNYTDINTAIFNSDFNVVSVPAVNTLINGRNNYDCSLKDPGDNTPCRSDAGLATFKFQRGKKHLLRIVNAGSSALQTFSIDGHNMTVIANDFGPVVPYQVQYLKLGVGQRTDVIVETRADEKENFFLRSQSPDRPCANTIQPNVTAIAYFDDPGAVPKNNPWPSFRASIQDCENEPLEKTVPLYPQPAPANPAATYMVNMTLSQNATGSWLFQMNGSAFRGNYNHPILLLTSIRMILYNHNERSHPMHLHGHNYYVEAIGHTSDLWDGRVARPANPQRRDTQIVPAFGYMVISFETDNPGAWAFHCHVAWHVATGLYMTVLERPDLIAKYRLPSTVAQTCRQWWAYTNTTVVEQIDSWL